MNNTWSVKPSFAFIHKFTEKNMSFSDTYDVMKKFQRKLKIVGKIWKSTSK